MASASLAPFRSRNFSLMWAGALLSNIGTWMESVGLSYHVARTTGKASRLALVGAAAFLPNGVLGPIGSAMADRWSRRRMLVIGNALSAVVAAILAVRGGGGAVSGGGIGAAVWCNAISFGAVIIAVGLVKVPHRHGERRRVFAALADGM